MFFEKISTPLIVVLSVLVAALTLRFFVADIDLVFKNLTHQTQDARVEFLLHIFASSLALAVGAFQMIQSLRHRYIGLHRWMGRIYAVAVAIGGLAGLNIAFNIEGGLATVGFAMLAIFWLIATGQAVLLARARKIAQHRRWMICSFALTFAAVTLRLQLLVFHFGFSMPYSEVYTFLAWSCWVPNILFALWYIRRAPS
ncbi:DUF2306 domain-containing protein [Planktotalea sp.]|uniref:DUF2306 domain-containing protein n=1 Tax=Planktotalea sp. TaxID=2029877 RepID=UPI003D6B07D7